MIPGIPGGKQLAVSLSSGALASNAFFLAAYSGVSDGPAAKPRPRPLAAALAPPRCSPGPAGPPRPSGAAGAAPRGGGPPHEISHTPVKSGSFAMRALSAADW